MSIPLIVTRSDGFYKIPLFEKLGVRAAFTNRDVDMSFESPARPAAYAKMGINPARLVCPSQVHADNVLCAQEEHKGRGAYARASAIQETDAIMTQRRFLPLSIQTADCLPVFLFDTDKRAIALIHAGWKGLHKDIIAKTISSMKKEFKTRPKNLIAALGPALRSCCYEVGPEFFGYFPGLVCTRGKGTYFDIVTAAGFQLTESGVSGDRIHDCRMCTSCLNKEFFSYRRERQHAGRSMSVFEIL